MNPIRRAKVRTKQRHSVWPPWRITFAPGVEVLIYIDPARQKRFTCADCGHRFGVNDEPDEDALIAHFGCETNAVVCPRCFSTGLHADALDAPHRETI